MIGRLAGLAFVLASLPAPPATAESGVLIAQLCNGGTIAIPLGDGKAPPPPEPCSMKACHAGNCRNSSDRKQFDRSQ